MSVSSVRRRPSMVIYSGEKVKSAAVWSGEYGDDPMMSHCLAGRVWWCSNDVILFGQESMGMFQWCHIVWSGEYGDVPMMSHCLVRRVWGCSNDVTLFFAKKSWTKTESSTKTDRCARALSWRRHPAAGTEFSGLLLTPSLRRQVLTIHSFTFKDELITDNSLAVKNSCRFYQRIPGTSWIYYL